jgi:cob(I)alamin adenosyltransferase
MSEIGRGYIHIYTGNGKGKTTAALGLALRAAGVGLKTNIVQFMKGQHYSELDSIKKLRGRIYIEQYGDKEFCRITDPPDSKFVVQAERAITRVKELMDQKECDILVADEIITSVLFHLIGEDSVIEIMKRKPDGMELILTGRGASDRLINEADLVTEMREIKHYYKKGIIARKGIEM